MTATQSTSSEILPVCNKMRPDQDYARVRDKLARTVHKLSGRFIELAFTYMYTSVNEPVGASYLSDLLSA